MNHRCIKTEQGAALVLALLVMLVLSGLGLVALQSVTDTSSISGMHRLQVQAKSVSDAVNQVGVMRSGSRAASVHAVLQGEGLEAEHDYEPGGLDPDDDYGRLRRGGFIVFSNEDGPGEINLSGADGGPLLDGENFEAVEADFMDHPSRTITYDYIVRDPVTGPRAAGFGDEFCFVVITVGSRSRLGGQELTGEERVRQAQALARNATRTMIGPIECG